MNKKLFRSCLVTAAALILPGCLAINALLGIAGFLTTGPIQYAGTAYSIGEYTYEYAVNDKTPDEVIAEKFAWLAEPEPAPQMTGYAKATEKTVVAPATPEARPAVRMAEASLASSPNVTLRPKENQPAPTMVATLRSRPVPPRAIPVNAPKERPQRTASAFTAQVKVPTPAPQHVYVERESDPLLDRLARMEQAFAQAERIAHDETPHGVRYSIPAVDTGQTETGINGSWSIRHHVMQPPPVKISAAGADHLSS